MSGESELLRQQLDKDKNELDAERAAMNAMLDAERAAREAAEAVISRQLLEELRL